MHILLIKYGKTLFVFNSILIQSSFGNKIYQNVVIINLLLYDHVINNLLSGFTTLSLYRELKKLYHGNIFDLLIYNEHKVDVKCEIYIKLDELVTI
ncbi:CYIR protein [Plasmodium cynomolgi strain B]|uniref:CYIR protein n=1 Tax=Plasmodium cynomolgi (strain B) TaxID=1120755 RepID=K6UP00_PLACD|nr:CYIR protein [Plasmodium cynomolgi strain B]GAB69958.1 CYIR protein [Plasmodium cynomolgi strain B]